MSKKTNKPVSNLVWINGPLRLDLLVEDGDLYYVRSHSANIFEMEQGPVDTAEQLDQLINWIKTSSRWDYEKRECFGDPGRFTYTSGTTCVECKWKEECEVAVVTGAR